ncbi:MAG: hypothetical protein J0L51_00045 [Rhizobiales bacterium]|nr:hypothetical protein [Hyphomicrobiales bacterium]
MSKNPTKAKAASPAPPPQVSAEPEKMDAFILDFLTDPPREAATGSYGPTVNDRWHGRRFDVPDGEHEAMDGWFFTFLDGAFTGARQAVMQGDSEKA